MTKSKTKISIVLLIVLTLALIGSVTPFIKTNKAFAEEWSETEINAEYAFGSSFTVPEKTVTVGGNTVKATATVVYPSGKATYANTLALDETGIYSVKYYASVGGKPYSTDASFTVKSRLFSHSDKSTVTYGKDENAETLSGLLVSLAQNDTLTFNQYIDVKDLTADARLIKLFALTSTPGVAEFSKLIFTITDAADSENYIRIEGRRRDGTGVDDTGITFVYAGANGQDMIGVEGEKIHKNDTLGQSVNHSFDRRFVVVYGDKTAKFTFENSDALPMDIRYDDESKEISVVEQGYDRNGNWNTERTKFVTDLDNPKYYDKLFTGFKSDKVILSVSAASYNAAFARFCITDVLGTDLTKTELVDNEPPVIEIDTDYEEMPEAEINTAYPVPDATANDLYSGDCPVSVEAYYNYNGATPVSVSITDGKFIPVYKGYYAIVYTAFDGVGNKAEKILWVHAGAEIAPLTVEVKSYEKTVLAGVKPEPAELGITGGSGKANVELVACFGSEEYEVTDDFRPLKTGKWIIKVNVTDYLGNEAHTEYEINVVAGDKPVMPEGAVLPKIFISDATYLIPEVYCEDYSGGESVKRLCYADIEYGGKTVRINTGEKFKPSVTEDGQFVKIKYGYNGAEIAEYEIPVVRAYIDQRFYVDKYVYADDGLIATATDDGVKLGGAAKREKAGFTFANSLVADGFNVTFVTVPTRTNFEAIKITLTAADDPTVVASARIVNDGNFVYFEVGDRKIRIEKAFSGMESTYFPIGYSDKSFSLDKTAIEIAYDDNGKSFKGFDDKVWLTVEFEGVRSGSEILLSSVNDCPFTTGTRDRVAPKISVKGDYGGSYSIGDEYVIPAIVAGDVHSPNVDATLTVTDEDGNIVSDLNGVKLEEVDPYVEYTVKLSRYGNYRIYYLAQENTETSVRPNKKEFTYSVIAEDNDAPAITLKSGYTKNLKVGGTLVVPDVEVKDNYDAAGDIVVTKVVINPNGRQIALYEGNSLKCGFAGVYEIRITATDLSGNSTVLRLFVTVK